MGASLVRLGVGEKAKAFQREFLGLYHRYAALSPARKEKGQPRYLVHLGLAPAPK